MTNNVAGGVESVASHLHPTPSREVADHPVPTGREEVWRFTPLDRLKGLHADAEFGASSCEYTWTEPDRVRVHPVDGEELAAWRGFSGYVPTDRTSARILAEVPSSLVIDVNAEADVAEPIRTEFKGTTADATEAGHIAIRVGHHARCTIVFNHTGHAAVAQVVELDAGEGSDVTFVTVQDWADDTVHLAHQHTRIGRDAVLRHVTVTLGGDAVRLGQSVEYAGPGGEANYYGLYFADAGQHLEHRLFVDHNEPLTHSVVDYRGALQGEGAHSVWVGDVLIRKNAEGISTYEQNRNLVLTDGCTADSVPNLEIETGEIAGAGHSSTTGRFDEQQLFYLMSRGIPEPEAKRLVVEGFFADIIRRIGVADLEERLLDAVRTELAASVTDAPAPAAASVTDPSSAASAAQPTQEH